MNDAKMLSAILSFVILLFILIASPISYKLTKFFFKKTSFKTLGDSSKIRVVYQLNEAVKVLSKEKTGAIITIQMKDNLEIFRTDGLIINANISASLIISIFNKKAPIHDGAIIIQNDKIKYVATYYKITSRSVDNKYGARHRAALGISESTDSVTVVVSEETGAVSIVKQGKIRKVSLQYFQESLLRYLK